MLFQPYKTKSSTVFWSHHHFNLIFYQSGEQHGMVYFITAFGSAVSNPTGDQSLLNSCNLNSHNLRKQQGFQFSSKGFYCYSSYLSDIIIKHTCETCTTCRHGLYNSMVHAHIPRYVLGQNCIDTNPWFERTNIPLSSAGTWTPFHHPHCRHLDLW